MLIFRTAPNSAALKDKLKSTTLTPSTATTTTTATKSASNFVRNTAKYATLPARRSKELAASMVAEEADNISEGEASATTTSGAGCGGVADEVNGCADLTDAEEQSTS